MRMGHIVQKRMDEPRKTEPRMSRIVRNTCSAAFAFALAIGISGCGGKADRKVVEVEEIQVYVKANAGEIERNAEITANMEANTNREEAE